MIGALGPRRWTRALELGCSVGVLSELLARHCDELVAVDISSEAVERARERLASAPNVTVERRTIPDEMPAGQFDLIVAADVMGYWNPELLLTALRRLEDALAPGGTLLAVNWRPGANTHALSGERVHRLLKRHSRLQLAHREVRAKHRLDRFEKA